MDLNKDRGFIGVAVKTLRTFFAAGFGAGAAGAALGLQCQVDPGKVGDQPNLSKSTSVVPDFTGRYINLLFLNGFKAGKSLQKKLLGDIT